MSGHTPGPWTLVETPDDVMISDWHIQVGEYPIKLFPFARQYSECRKFSGLVTDHQKMADARLIAAAPDLLEALETITALYAGEMYSERSIKEEDLPEVMAARKAIARAKGQA